MVGMSDVYLVHILMTFSYDKIISIVVLFSEWVKISQKLMMLMQKEERKNCITQS